MLPAAKLLTSTYKRMLSEPVEGVFVELVDDSNLFEWRIWLEGPKDTLYETGVFQLIMTFPTEYPMAPPELKFISDFWHPNVYKETGNVCISILHPPGEDEMSGELPEERWLPTQTVQTILLSVISLLNAPNFSSPANVDAGVEWRKAPDLYKKRIIKLVEKANAEKPKNIVIPHPDTNPEEKKKQVEKIMALSQSADVMEDELMYDSREPSDDEQEPEESEENQSQSEEKSQSKKSASKGSEKKTDAKSKDLKVEKLSEKKHRKGSKDAKNKDQEPSLTEEQTAPRKKKKKCTIM